MMESQKASIRISIDTHVKVCTTTYPFEELREIPINYSLDDLSIDVCKPNTEVGSHNQQAGKDYKIKCLLGVVGGNHYLDELFYSRQENFINVSFASLKPKINTICNDNLIDRLEQVDPIY